MFEFVSEHQFWAAVAIYWIFSAAVSSIIKASPWLALRGPILGRSAVRAICGYIASCTASPAMSQRRLRARFRDSRRFCSS